MRENVDYLQKLGLTEYQARTMVVLFSNGETTAEQISKTAMMPHTKVYQTLKNLEYMGFVFQCGGRPRRYKGVEPNTFLNMLLKKSQKKIEVLRKEKEKQLRMIRSLKILPNIHAAAKRVHPCISTEQYKIGIAA